MTLPPPVITRSKRRTLSIHITPNLIEVRAPNHLAEYKIHEFLLRKHKWIHTTFTRITALKKDFPTPTFENGDTLLIMGKQHRLHLINGRPKRIQINPDTTSLEVTHTNPTPDKIERMIHRWYRDQLQFIIENRIAVYQPKIKKPYSQIQYKKMRSRWGSCSATGVLVFNVALIKTPLHIIDYIVVHELAHLVHLNHSKRFWNLVESILPDYKKANAWLKEFGPGIH